MERKGGSLGVICEDNAATAAAVTATVTGPVRQRGNSSLVHAPRHTHRASLQRDKAAIHSADCSSRGGAECFGLCCERWMLVLLPA